VVSRSGGAPAAGTVHASFREFAEDGLVDRLPAAVYAAFPGESGRWLYVSERIGEITGFSAEEFMADPGLWSRQLHERDRDRVVGSEASKLVAGFHHTSEYRMVRKDGQVIWVLDDMVLENAVGQSELVHHGLLSDITHRKRTELLLAEHGQILQRLAHGDDLPLILSGLADSLEHISGAARCVLEVEASELQPGFVAGSAAGSLGRGGRVRQVPISGVTGEPVGRLVLRYPPGRTPSELDDELATWGVRLAAMALQRAGEHERLGQSVALLEATLESTVDGILVVDSAGRITRHNQRFAQMWRIAEAVLASGDDARIMRSVLEQLVSPQKFVARIHELYADPTESSFDELEFKDGRVYERYSQPQLVDGESVGRVWSFRDVTVRRQLELELRAQAAQLRRSQTWVNSVTETAPDAIIVMDGDGLIRSWNSGARRMFGHSGPEVVGRPVTVLMPERYRQAHRDGLAGRVDNIGEMHPRVIEIEALRRDGTEFPIDLSLSSWSDEGMPYFTGVIRDVTERRQAGAALERERRLVELLGRVAAAANEAESVEDALQRALDEFCTYGGWVLGHAYLTEEDDPASLQHSVWHVSGDDRFEDFRAVTEAASFSSEAGLPGRLLTLRAPMWMQGISSDEDFLRREVARRCGLESACGFPIMVRDQPVGVMEFFSPDSLLGDEAMIRVMQHLGAQLGRVVERDRAEHRLAQHTRELERLTRQQESILNSAGDGIYGLDVDNRITFINEAGARLIGAPREKVVGRAVGDVIRVEVQAEVREPGANPPAAESPVAGAQSRLMSGRHHRLDGSVFDSEHIAAPIVQDGAVVGSVVIFRDVSERRAVDKMKDEFISVVSHELRTPLTSIRGALGLLAGGATGPLPSRAQRMVDVATTSTDRLIRLINDILDVERMAAGKLTLHRVSADVAGLVATAVEETRALAHQAGVTLTVGSVPGTVWADPDRVVQTLSNLLGNSVKFSPTGAEVRLTVTQAGGEVRFDVADLGPGIPADKLEAVFDRFHQVDASDTRQKGGSGLGLAICKGIVEQHGGRIWASSDGPGQGSTFSFTLPAGTGRPYQPPPPAPDGLEPTTPTDPEDRAP
jgi:PAS domain S-box-containing protein